MKLKFLLKALVFSIILISIWLELVIRATTKFPTYSEKTNGYFVSYYNKVYPFHYYTWTPNDLVSFNRQEFNYQFQTNSLGLRDKEFQPKKNENGFRVIAMGDSFTEGVGTPNDSTFPVQLEILLNQYSKLNYEVWNAGVSGSDPIYCHKLFADKLLPFSAELVVLIMNNSDIVDLIFRGGYERFLDDGTSKFKPSPWILPLYKYSHFLRMIFQTLGYDEALLSPSQKEKESKIAITKISESLTKFYNSCQQNGTNFIVIFHAFPGEYRDGFNAESNILELIPHLEANQIPHISLHGPMGNYLNKENITSYSWPIDGHYNGKGYQIMAKCIFEEITRKYPELLQINDSQKNSQNSSDTASHSAGLVGLN